MKHENYFLFFSKFLMLYLQCSKQCNGGIQSRNAFCTSDHRGQIIDEKYCAHLTKDELQKSCNTHECAKWQYGDESVVNIYLFYLSVYLSRFQKIE